MKAKITLNPQALGNILKDYEAEIENIALSKIHDIMFEPVLEESEPYAPYRKGGFFREMGTRRLAYPIGNGVFRTEMLIDPEEPSKGESEWLDRNYYLMTGEEVETKQRYGKHSYYNSFTGTSDFFKISLPKAKPFIEKNMARYLIRRR